MSKQSLTVSELEANGRKVREALRAPLLAHGFALIAPMPSDTPRGFRFYSETTGQSLRFWLESDTRLEVTGELPRFLPNGASVWLPSELTPPKIGVSLAKSPEQIARDIARRLLPELAKVWPEYQRRVSEVNGYVQRLNDGRAALEASGLVKFREPGPYQSRAADDSQSFTIPALSASSAHAQCELTGSSIKLHLSSLTVDQALRVIRALSSEE